MIIDVDRIAEGRFAAKPTDEIEAAMRALVRDADNLTSFWVCLYCSKDYENSRPHDLDCPLLAAQALIARLDAERRP